MYGNDPCTTCCRSGQHCRLQVVVHPHTQASWTPASDPWPAMQSMIAGQAGDVPTGGQGGQSQLARQSKTPAPPPRSSIARTSAQREQEKSQNVMGGGPTSWTNPLGRHSMSQATPQQVRASLCRLGPQPSRPGFAAVLGLVWSQQAMCECCLLGLEATVQSPLSGDSLLRRCNADRLVASLPQLRQQMLPQCMPFVAQTLLLQLLAMCACVLHFFIHSSIHSFTSESVLGPADGSADPSDL